MATRKFNIDEVVAGAEIVQRCGFPAKFLLYVPEAYDVDNVVWIDEDNRINQACPDGRFYVGGGDSEHDLFIWEPDPPAPKKIIQAHTGTRINQGKVFDVWYDTLWDSVNNAREHFPNEIYREILVVP